MEESYGPEADSNDVDPPTNDVNFSAASAVNSSVLNKDILPDENDDYDASTSAFVENIEQNEVLSWRMAAMRCSKVLSFRMGTMRSW